jgi:ATP-dependent Clp protease ATP-binding subunit ClpA
VPRNVVKFVNEQGYSKEYGARNLRRKVQELLESGLANFLISQNYKQSKKELRIKVELDKDKLAFQKV